VSESRSSVQVVRGSDAPATSQEGIEIVQGVALGTADSPAVWFGLFKTVPGVRIPPHFHTHDSVAYLMSGRAAFTIGQERIELSPGDWLHVPKQLVHTEETVGGEIAEFVFATDPAGLTPVFSSGGEHGIDSSA